MKKIEQLPEATEQALFSLRADDALKHRIFEQAAASGTTGRKSGFFRPAVCLSLLSAAMIAVFVLLSGLGGTGTTVDNDIHTISAGSYRSVSPVHLGDLVDGAEEAAVEETAEEAEEDENETAGPEEEPAEEEAEGENAD
ncbi:MAG: hypothetical protein K6E17_04465 [Clostridiales bacterium]|nr:hypothetical protein [Clostridiales bacterium]